MLNEDFAFTFTYPFTAGGRCGTADDFTISFLHFSLFSTALWDLENFRPEHLAVGNGQVLWTRTGKEKTLKPSVSLPFMGEVAVVKTASLG